MASIKARVGLYEVVETLGSGSFGKVKLARHVVTGHQVALKFVNKTKMAREGMTARVDREIAYLRFLRHPHIIKLYEVVHTPSHLVMVIEYAGGELFQYIAERGRMAEDEARRFFQQLVAAIEYCHRHRIVHRDLKPENLLLDANKNLKLADFGLSNTMSDGDFLKTSCGSPNYAAPEVIAGKLYAGPEVDVWSCGVILYVMLVGRLPFDDEYIPALFHKISSGIYQVPPFLSRDATHLLAAMLQVDPLKRITVPDIRTHPFFTTKLPAYLAPLPPVPGTMGSPVLSGNEDDEDAEVAGQYDPLALADLAAKLAQEVSAVRDRLDAATAAAPGAEDDDPLHVAYRLCADARMLWCGGRQVSAQRDAHWRPSPSPPSHGVLVDAAAAATAERRHDSATASSPASSAARDTIGVLARRGQHASPPFGDAGASAVAATIMTPGAAAAAASAHKKKARSRWHVGIRSRSHAVDVMLELYKALAAVGCEWKVAGAFAVRARDPESGAKLDLQLFRVDAGYYLVDFKRVLPPPIPRESGALPTPGQEEASIAGESEPKPPAAGDNALVAGQPGVFEFLDLAVRVITELARAG